MVGIRPPITDEPLRLLALLLLLPLLAACDEPAPDPLSPAEAAERDSVLALLRAADTESLAAAFDRLDAFRYRVVMQTEQFESGDQIAQRTLIAEVVPMAGGPDIDFVQIDSSGAFDFGGFAAFASESVESPLPAENPATLALPDDPAYLDPRGRETFRFRFAPDTLLGDRRVQVLTVEAREDDQALRRARLYLDDEGALVGVRLQRRTESVIFSEQSDTAVLLQPGPAGGWLPHLTRIETALGALGTDRRRFRLTRRYADFEPAAAASNTLISTNG